MREKYCQLVMKVSLSNTSKLALLVQQIVFKALISLVLPTSDVIMALLDKEESWQSKLFNDANEATRFCEFVKGCDITSFEDDQVEDIPKIPNEIIVYLHETMNRLGSQLFSNCALWISEDEIPTYGQVQNDIEKIIKDALFHLRAGLDSSVGQSFLNISGINHEELKFWKIVENLCEKHKWDSVQIATQAVLPVFAESFDALMSEIHGLVITLERQI